MPPVRGVVGVKQKNRRDAKRSVAHDGISSEFVRETVGSELRMARSTRVSKEPTTSPNSATGVCVYVYVCVRLKNKRRERCAVQ